MLQPITKTISGRLVPIGATKQLLSEARQGKGEIANAIALHNKTPEVKGVLDDFYREIIKHWLTTSGLSYKLCNQAYEAYHNPEEFAQVKSEIEKKLKTSLLCTEVYDSKYNASSKDIFKNSLLKMAKDLKYDAQKMELILSVEDDGRFFDRIVKNRSTLFNDSNKHGSVMARLINDNLPIYFINVDALKMIKEEHPDALSLVDKDLVDEINPELYCDYLLQEQIAKYNRLIGEINISINQYNQKNKTRLRKLAQLQKVPLFESEKLFVIEKIESDEELLKITNDTYEYAAKATEEFAKEARELFGKDNIASLMVERSSFNSMSACVYHNYKLIEDAIIYHISNLTAKEAKKAQKLKSFALEDIVSFINEYAKNIENADFAGDDIYSYYMYEADEFYKEIAVRFNAINKIIKSGKYRQGDGEALRDFYDACIKIYQTYKTIRTNDDQNPTNIMLKEFLEQYYIVVKNYNLARNYATKKPYTTEKIEVNFGSSNFGVGDSHYIDKSKSFWLTKDGYIYFCVVPKQSKVVLNTLMEHKGEGFKFLYWHQLSSIGKQIPRIFILAKDSREKYGYTDEIRYIYDTAKYKTDKDAEAKWINYIYNCFINSENYDIYDLKNRLRKPSEYSSYTEFYNELEYALYTTRLIDVSEDYINKAVEEGSLYLFKFMTQDFSDSHIRKKSKDSSHTLTLKELFTERNSDNIAKMLPHVELLGGTKVFYRAASIEKKVTHKAGTPLANKNPNNPKKTRTLPYDLYKDKRYMEDGLFVSLCVCQNVNTKENVSTVRNNVVVNKELKVNPKNVMAIVRGNAHLLYYTVTSPAGMLLCEGSLNEIKYSIDNSDNPYEISIDFKEILERAKCEYDLSVKNWTYHKGINNIKEGYLTRALSEICKIRDKYDAIIIIEDMNLAGSSRTRLDSKIYGAFEKKLIGKLNQIRRADGTLEQYTIVDAFAYRTQNGYVFTTLPYYLASKLNDDYIDLISYNFKYVNLKQAKTLLKKVKIEYSKGDFTVVTSYDAFGVDRLKNHEFVFKVNRSYNVYNGTKYEVVDASKELSESFEACGIDYKHNVIDTDNLDTESAKRVIAVMRLTLGCKDTQDGEMVIVDNLLSIDGNKHKPMPKTTMTKLKCQNMTEKLYKALLTVDENGKMDYTVENWLNGLVC